MRKVLSNLILLSFMSSLFYSCNKEADLAPTTTIIKPYKINHETNYDEIRSKITSNESISIEFKGYNFDIVNLKVAQGITIEKGILLDNDKNEYVFVDDVTNRIYIYKTDYDQAIQTEVYIFKDKFDKKLLIEEYDLNSLNETPGKFVEAENSYMIQKIIPKSEEEILNSFDGSLTAGCNTSDKQINPSFPTVNNIDKAENSKIWNTWNIYLYKQSPSVDVAASVTNFYTSWKSLKSISYSARSPYANINIVYDNFSYTHLTQLTYSQLNNFGSTLRNNHVSTLRSIHVYLIGNNGWEVRGRAFGKGPISISGNLLRYAIASTVSSQALAHEIGHCIGADHDSNIHWDTSIGLFGWNGSDVMCTPLGAVSWRAPQYHKFYNTTNRAVARRVLDFY